MRVLTPGDKTKTWPVQAACSCCNATLEVSIQDIYTKTSRTSKTRTTRAYFTCPECDSDESPENIQHAKNVNLPTYSEFWIAAQRMEGTHD